MATSKTSTPSTRVHNGLLPTPPMPRGLPKANLTDNARQVLMKRYVRRDDDGKPADANPDARKSIGEQHRRLRLLVAFVEHRSGPCGVLRLSRSVDHGLSEPHLGASQRNAAPAAQNAAAGAGTD